MVRNRVRLLATTALAALAIPLAMVSGATMADAEVIGALTVDPPTGADDTPMTVSTNGPCPTTATTIMVTIRGAGFPADGFNIVGATPLTSLPVNASGGKDIPVGDTLRNYAAQQTPPATLNGRYDITGVCRTTLSPTSLGDFTGAIQFDTPTSYHSVTGTPTPTPTPTGTPTPTPTPTGTPTPTPTPTESPTPTDSATPTDTPSPTPTDQTPGGQQIIGVSVSSGAGGSGSGGSGSGSGGMLPNTGVAWVSELTVLGLWLVTIGMLLVGLARTHRPGATEPGRNR